LLEHFYFLKELTMTITISKKVITPLLTLLIGFALGVTGTLPSNAEDPAPVVQGEILKVCINLKTGVIRVANKCDTKTERKTILGGVGAQGAKGDKGDTGATGATGAIGAQGPQGSIGATGPQGERGLIGATGAIGAQGPQGSIGATGPQGERGLTGATGAIGAQGPQGSIGATGPQGERGLTGATGAIGPQGERGLTGATGSMSGLRTQSIKDWDKDIFGSCSTIFGVAMLGGNTSLSQYSNTITLNKSCVSMSYRNVTVYVP
jgi:hypothetical protein